MLFEKIYSFPPPIYEYHTEVSGVYFLIYNGVIVYIGASENIYQRIRAHAINRKIPFSHFAYYYIHTWKMYSTEKILIDFIKPVFNIADNPIAMKEMALARKLSGIKRKNINRTKVVEILTENGIQTQLR